MSPIAENLRTRARSTEEQKFKKLVLNEYISRESQAVKAKTIRIFNGSKTSVEFLMNAAPFPLTVTDLSDILPNTQLNIM
jgi:hypothetical protein